MHNQISHRVFIGECLRFLQNVRNKLKMLGHLERTEEQHCSHLGTHYSKHTQLLELCLEKFLQ